MAYNLNIPREAVNDMPNSTFLGWIDYFDRRPVGWRADLRSYYQLKAAGAEDIKESIYPSLTALFNENKKHLESDGNKVKQSAFFGMMLQAKGGKQLE